MHIKFNVGLIISFNMSLQTLIITTDTMARQFLTLYIFEFLKQIKNNLYSQKHMSFIVCILCI